MRGCFVLAPGCLGAWRHPRNAGLVSGFDLLSYVCRSLWQCRGSQRGSDRQIPSNGNVSLNANLNAQADLLLLVPTYTFATPLLGGQFAVSMMSVFGRNSVGVDGTLTLAAGSIIENRMGSIANSLTAFGDLYPTATLKWHDGTNNWMTYMTGDIPVGAYDPNRLAKLGSVTAPSMAAAVTPISIQRQATNSPGVAGFTLQLKNQDTQYQNGIDFHFDWGASRLSQSRSSSASSGMPINRSLTIPDKTLRSGGMRSRVLGVGPQIGYLFPIGNKQGYLNLKGYGEFDAANRPSGWNTWLTFSISDAPPASTVTPTKHLVTK